MSGSLETAKTGKKGLSERFFAVVVHHRKLVIALFLIVAAICAVMNQFVGVDYDMNDYLPDSASSTISLDKMEAEFDGAIPNARVMIKDVSVTQALEYKSDLEAVDGVSSITWLDDAIDIATPIELADQDTVDTYYKDNNALFSVAIDESKRIEAVDDIRALIGDENCMEGSAVSTALATTSTVSQIQLITIFAIAFILLVLIITTNTWIEPLLVLFGLGVAVIINNGTNLMFGTVSFVTNAAGSILQVAIALDFSVFLLHRYSECRGTTTGGPETDMVDALCKTRTAILSSACTVMIGFLALCVMQFKIGPDLGYALAKGILISLITVFTFTPSVFVCADALLDKTAHRPFVPQMGKFAQVVAKVCVPLAAVFILLPVPAYLCSTSDDVNYWYGAAHIFGSETQLGADTDEIVGTFGKSDTYVLMVPKGDTAREAQLNDALKNLPQVTSVISYVNNAGSAIPSEVVDSSTLSQLEGEHYARMVLSVDVDYEGDDTFDLVEAVRTIVQEYYPDEWYLAGQGVSTTDLMETIVEDKELVDVIAALAVLVVLLFATRSISLPVILVFVIETSIWANFAVPYFTGSHLFFISYLIVSSVQLGVTVDYAILMTDRYKENRLVMPKKQALVETVKSVTIPICTSGVVLVVVGFLLSIISTHGILAMLGHYLGVGVTMSLIAVLFVLPGFLYVLDAVINKTTLKANFLMPNKDEKGNKRTETPQQVKGIQHV